MGDLLLFLLQVLTQFGSRLFLLLLSHLVVRVVDVSCHLNGGQYLVGHEGGSSYANLQDFLKRVLRFFLHAKKIYKYTDIGYFSTVDSLSINTETN